jgi:hypothetical protein
MFSSMSKYTIIFSLLKLDGDCGSPNNDLSVIPLSTHLEVSIVSTSLGGVYLWRSIMEQPLSQLRDSPNVYTGQAMLEGAMLTFYSGNIQPSLVSNLRTPSHTVVVLDLLEEDGEDGVKELYKWLDALATLSFQAGLVLVSDNCNFDATILEPYLSSLKFVLFAGAHFPSSLVNLG